MKAFVNGNTDFHFQMEVLDVCFFAGLKNAPTHERPSVNSSNVDLQE